MALEKITGSKPQEVKKLDVAEKKATPVRQDADKKPPVETNVPMAQVSERSRAASKAYWLAMESKPFLSRVSKVAQIKAQVINGTYRPASPAVADAVLKNIASGA
jgi:anti-sigma28 factor (negative regulator of flagellin synthesis)